jgi:bidirectional [NiFe] hydrogenase diaphorase subunit
MTIDPRSEAESPRAPKSQTLRILEAIAHAKAIGKEVELRIDGNPIKVPIGTTILEAAQKLGIRIPTLCYHEDLCLAGVCRICVVEVAKQRTLQTACTFPVTEPITVSTTSQRVRMARRHILDLLLSKHYGECYSCFRNNNCELQALAQLFVIDHVRYGFLAPQLSVDISHAHFGIDHNRCILCRRCLRVCDEIEGAHTWDVGGRGAASRIISDLAQPWGDSATCTGCSKCVQCCPTGALFEKGVEATPKRGVCLERLVEWRGRKHR